MDFCQTILRYCMLSYILCIRFKSVFSLSKALKCFFIFSRRISVALQHMFPDDKSLIDAKVATKKEMKIITSQGEPGRVWWIPISWSMTMIKRCFLFIQNWSLNTWLSHIREGFKKRSDFYHFRVWPPPWKWKNIFSILFWILDYFLSTFWKKCSCP